MDVHNTLVLGSGGREHAIAKSLTKSQIVGNLYIAPGNGGTLNCATNLPDINIHDVEQVANAIRENEISLLIIGPEDPLVNGLRNQLEEIFTEDQLAIVGPNADGAQLEGSKDFAKQFMLRNNIPTAGHQTFISGQENEAKAYLAEKQAPFVLKADGLLAGKGVLILEKIADAEKAIDEILKDGKFGDAGNRLVIEDFLDGIEFSVFAAVDGNDYVLLPVAKDYKRIGEGDTGLNTGGMGAVSPPPFVDAALMQKVESRIVKRTMEGLKKENIDYRGIIFFGLINVEGEPYVIEYNCRLGDPETEVILPRITSDFGKLCLAIHKRQIADYEIEITTDTAATVIVVSGGYPEAYKKGIEISGLNQVPGEITLFHAGTRREGDKILTNGGRVLAFTAMEKNHQHALMQSYQAIRKICFQDMYFRKDIGFDL
ncbi:MAG: phosphoribosylamine--glycine ligase [Cryomorphaceae bacterium]|nr:phosphoribosylamine--glycine ligase [Cryomorphaceae bacterium]